MSESFRNGMRRPVIVAGFSSQILASEIAFELDSKVVLVTRKQFNDKEIQTTIEENVRGLNVVVVASAAGDPNKQEKEARLLMRAANRAGANRVTLFLPYMWYGRSDDIWDDRNSPALSDTIETLRPHCQNAIVADPHNATLTREKFLDGGGVVRTCEIVHFAFPFAIQIRDLINSGYIVKNKLVMAHADVGSTKRISVSFRTCMYNILGFNERDPNKDGWPVGLKDHDKRTGDIRVTDFSGNVRGRDVVIFEDMISGSTTACGLGDVLKKKKARSATLFATSGLFTPNPKNNDTLTASVDRINNSQLDAVFITDTYNHLLTDPKLHEAIQASPIIHVIKTAPYLASIIAALHIEVGEGTTDENSISAILRGVHPDQLGSGQTIANPTSLKQHTPLLTRAFPS